MSSRAQWEELYDWEEKYGTSVISWISAVDIKDRHNIFTTEDILDAIDLIMTDEDISSKLSEIENLIVQKVEEILHTRLSINTNPPSVRVE